MASRHDIINITFQANAGKANVALQALQAEAKKSSDRVNELKRYLDEGLRANIPADQIQRIRNDIKVAEKEVKQWNNAYKELIKGVRTLDEAVKQFNAGTLGQMSAAFNKAAANSQVGTDEDDAWYSGVEGNGRFNRGSAVERLEGYN